jgi:hypothetical protein
MGIEQIESEALKLDHKSRAKLANKLLQSLDSLSDTENERLWAEEAMRRHEDLESGKSLEIDAEEVLSDAYARLAKK